MIKKLFREIIKGYGYELNKIRSEHDMLGYDLEDEANEAIEKVQDYTMLSRNRLITLYQQVVFCEKSLIPGSFVECGVWKGGAVGLMALANLRRGKTRRHIHIFDSFQEICEPDERVDGERAIREVKMWSRGGGTGGKLSPIKGFYSNFGGPGTLEGNKDLLERIIGYDPKYLHYHEGWFQETLPSDAANIDSIAILRLDGDWYASTKICLQYLYDKVVSGGFVIIDDYGAYEGCKRAVQEFMTANNICAFLHHIDEAGRYWIKP